MKTIRLMLFLVAAFETAATQAAPTTGVYDENVIQPNQVDFVATGSSFTATQFADRLSTAFLLNAGGVINGSVLGGFHEYGVNYNKTLRFLPASGTNWGIGSPTSTVTPISGTGAFASSSEGGYNFTAFSLQVLNGNVGERVIALGVTVLSVDQRNYGNVTVSGLLASGGTISAVRAISEPDGRGDTFFGLGAPDGDHFTHLQLRYSGAIVPDVRLWFDDIGFITSAIPEPSTASLLCLAVCVAALLRCRRSQTS